jgi:hypothetical protein
LRIKLEGNKKRESILIASEKLNNSQVKALLSVTKMEEALKNEHLKNIIPQKNNKLDYNIDTKGVIIYNIKEIGAVIRDNGQAIYCSKTDQASLNLVKQYAILKWGSGLIVEGNVFKPSSKSLVR